MVKYYPSIPDNLRDWALVQPMFFVGSAPWTGKHVNISPKGLPSSTFTITSPNSCAYVDKTGSGSETIAHIYENKRVVLMFCSFDTLPRIMRFWCWGSVVEWDSPDFEPALVAMGQSRHSIPGARAVIRLDVWKVGTSCGTGVPILAMQTEQSLEEFEAALQQGKQPAVASDANGDANAVKKVKKGLKSKSANGNANANANATANGDAKSNGNANGNGNGAAPIVGVKAGEVLKDRVTLSRWAEKMSSSGKLEPYQRDNNAWSLDGCTGMRAARRSRGQKALWLVERAVWARRVLLGEWEAVLVGVAIGVSLMVVARMLESIRA